MKKLPVRIIALLIGLFCMKEAAANLLFFQGVKTADPKAAVNAFERAARFSPRNPEYAWMLGKTIWDKKALGTAESIKEANRIFKDLSQKIPFYGKVWLYRAETELAALTQGGKKLSDEDWEKVNAWFGRAKDLAPGNAWVFYRTGLNRILYRGRSTAQRGLGLSELKKAAAIYPADYLKPGLDFLWKHYQDPRPLLYVLPRSYEGYEIFRVFCEENNLWKLREQTALKWASYRKSEYERHTQSGKEELAAGNERYAFFYFQKAYWLDPDLPAAKLGMIAAKSKSGEKVDWDYDYVLTEALEDEEQKEEVRDLLPELNPLIKETRDIYLKGLYAFNQEDWESAVKWLGQSPADGKFQKRYLAEAYARLGQGKQAYEILSPVLSQKDPDLRALLLLRSVTEPAERTKVEEKITKVQVKPLPRRLWKGRDMKNSILDRKGKMGTIVNLLPGPATLRIAARNMPDQGQQYGFIHVRLGEVLLGSFYVDHESWEEIEVSADSSGGKQWLNVELVNGAEREAGSGPAVELKDVIISYNT